MADLTKYKRIIGYARCGSTGQDLSIQLSNLKQAGCAYVYQEKVSGKDNNRPELNKMLTDLKEGDVLVICKLDRLAQSALGALRIVETLNKNKVDLVSLDTKESIDTTSGIGKCIFTILIAFAELERNKINERRAEGMIAAAAKGIKFGRTPGTILKATVKKTELIECLLLQGKPYKWILTIAKCSSRLVVAVSKRLVAEGKLLPGDERKKKIAADTASCNRDIKAPVSE